MLCGWMMSLGCLHMTWRKQGDCFVDSIFVPLPLGGRTLLQQPKLWRCDISCSKHLIKV